MGRKGCRADAQRAWNDAAVGASMDTYHSGCVARRIAACAVPRSHVARGQY